MSAFRGARVEDGSRRLGNCYEEVLWSLVGASNEAIRDNIEGVCEEDQLDKYRGSGNIGDELPASEACAGEVCGVGI